ncbi:MAG: helicase HerA domain-containing protein [Oscillochloridaceae bacterium umkhey_bin13]
MTEQRTRLGVITSGSLVAGLTARLEAQTSVEELRVGKFVVIAGEQHQFFSMVTDVALAATNQNVLSDPPTGDPFVHAVLAGTSTYGTLALSPRLMLPHDLSAQMLPVKTIPRHFAPVFEASEDDFTRVFGREGGSMFELGRPLDMDVPICLDLERVVERSNGIFGKSGTGKSFLTRLLLAGVIQTRIASNLIFDMHSEYGWDSRTESGGFVKGLRQLFGSEVQVYRLDRKADNRGQFDGDLVIGLDQIEVEDVTLLEAELNLSSTATESAYLLRDRFKERWLRELLEMDGEAIAAFAESSGAHAGAISALRRKLIQIRRLSFVQDSADFSAVDRMISALAAGRHVVLDFGSSSGSLAYMLVANLITRRIHRRWIEQTERFLASKNEADRPRPLMITLEEAHKFLNPQTARQTIFGTIARELRKYSVTLLVVDQRPASIDPEVMSQLGTRITALLTDDKDLDAVFTGVSGGTGLKAVLASLESKQQAMVLGHAVPMPVVIRTRPYDDAFYTAMQRGGPRQSLSFVPAVSAEEEMDELFPD